MKGTIGVFVEVKIPEARIVVGNVGEAYKSHFRTLIIETIANAKMLFVDRTQFTLEGKFHRVYGNTEHIQGVAWYIRIEVFIPVDATEGEAVRYIEDSHEFLLQICEEIRVREYTNTPNRVLN